MTKIQTVARKHALVVLLRTFLLLLVVGRIGLDRSALAGPGDPQVRLESLPSTPDYAGATAPDALQLACAPNPSMLADFFSETGLPFDPHLLRKTDGGPCHIFYRPTLPGFVADSAGQPVAELFFNVDTLSFLSGRGSVHGDALDVVKEILSRAGETLTVDLGLEIVHQRKWYERAARIHFPDAFERLRLRAIPGNRSFPWVQDYMKSGHVEGNRKILLPRMIYEGTPGFGLEFEPLLDAYGDARFVRSKLAWEGGDLQVVTDPRAPGRRLLIHGASAKGYWGRSLSEEEYSYVLKLEFGADLALSVPDIPGHVDYVAAFLPGEKVVLVSQILTGNLELARAASRVLRERYQGALPGEMQEISRLLESTSGELGRNKTKILRALHGVQQSTTVWAPPENLSLQERLTRLIDLECRDNVDDCFNLKAQDRLLASDLPLLADWVTEAMERHADVLMPRALLTVIESQLPGYQPRSAARLDDFASRLRKLGFEVIRIPRIAGDPELRVPWSGISYSNSLILDRLIFVPKFGFGAPEDEIFEDLQRSLPAAFEVVPVYSRRLLLFNGGLHCITGIVHR